MRIINRKYSPESFAKYINTLISKRLITKLVFHHTSSHLDRWNGSASILHYYNIYQSRGWASGPHIFVAPDGIWMFTDIRKRGTHAGKEGNAGSIGIEIVGNYISNWPDDERILRHLALVTFVLMKKFKLKSEHIKNHKLDYHPDSFCSPLLTKEWIAQNMFDHEGYINSVIKQ